MSSGKAMIASSQSLSMIQRRISLSPDPASPVNNGEPLNTIARREPSGFIFEIMCMRKRSAIINSRQAGPEAAFEGEFVMFLFYDVGLGFPLDAEGRIREQIVEPVPRQTVLSEAIAELDVLRVLALDHHVRTADGEGFVVVVLPKNFQSGVRVQLAEMFFCYAQHSARTASGIVERPHDALGAEDLAVRGEQQVDHQPDDLARREVVTGGLVRCFIEAPDQVLEDQAHLVIGDDVGMQIDVCELPDHQVEPVGLIQLGDFLLELEVLEYLPRPRRETLDVVRQVLCGLVRLALEF